MLPFASGVFLGAFLLFLVQPMMGKFVLPWFGGSPGVWAVCLVFFQTALLAGYAYADQLNRRLRVGRQVIVHLGLLAVGLAVLPPHPGRDWQPLASEAPAGQLWWLLTAHLGAPFLLVAATSPLLQRWFAHAHPDRSPYRLFALSNAGSLLALIGYPLLVERFFTRHEQAVGWSAGYAALTVAVAWCGRQATRTRVAAEASTQGAPVAGPTIGAGTRWRWLLYPAVATALLSATTTRLTLDVAAGPFLWVLPLAAYLLSFVLTFDHPRWYRPTGYAGATVAAAVIVTDLLVAGRVNGWVHQVAGYTAALFVACMVCHGEVHRLRPAAARLTTYYLHLATGGALGGAAVAFVAPVILDHHYDLQLLWPAVLVLVATETLRRRDRMRCLGMAGGLILGFAGIGAIHAFAVGAVSDDSPWNTLTAHRALLVAVGGLLLLVFIDPRHGWVRTWRWRHGMLAGLVPLAFAGLLARQTRVAERDEIFAVRTFHGSLIVREFNRENPAAHCRFLTHGSTTHGLQLLHADHRHWPTSYYGPRTGIGLALSRTNQPNARRVGVLGLGIGTLAAWGQRGETFHFFEIDPAVARVARSHFTFLDESTATIELKIGDGRLLLEAENDADAPRYDTLVIDAFNSDAVPTHLLTREAFATYFERLAPDGVLAINTANRLLDLRAVVLAQAHLAGWAAALIDTQAATDEWWAVDSSWVLLARDPATLTTSPIKEVAPISVPGPSRLAPWTDDRTDLWSAVY